MSVSPSTATLAAAAPGRRRTATAAPRSRRSSPSSDRRRGRRDRRERELRAAHRELDLLEAAVAERAPRERGDRALGRVGVELDRRALARDADALVAEPLGGGAARARACRPPAAAGRSGRPRSARRGRELVEQLGDLARRGADHLDVAGARSRRARRSRASVRAKPWTVASGVRRSWHASETSRANWGSSGTDSVGSVAAWTSSGSFSRRRPPGIAARGARSASRARACAGSRRRSGSATAAAEKLIAARDRLHRRPRRRRRRACTCRASRSCSRRRSRRS